MYILAIETSTQLGSVSLLENNQLLGEKTSTQQKSHSDFVHQAIDDVLAKASIKLNQIDVLLLELALAALLEFALL